MQIKQTEQTEQIKQTKQTKQTKRLLYWYRQAMLYWLMLVAIVTTIAVSTVVVWGGVYLLCKAAVYVHGLLH